MKKYFPLILIIFSLSCFNNIFASNNNDSLKIKELLNEVTKTKEKLKIADKKLTEKDDYQKFIPIRFTISITSKMLHDYLATGFATKFSFKQWNYKHYIYADITCGDNSYLYMNNPFMSFALGYLYNINNYFMVGPIVDFTVTSEPIISPGVILSITNDRYFIDLQGSYIGCGIGLGMCF